MGSRSTERSRYFRAASRNALPNVPPPSTLAAPNTGGLNVNLPVALQPEESVVLLIHRHWLRFAFRMAGAVLAWILPVTGVLLLAGSSYGLDGTAGKATWIAAGGWSVYWAVRAYFTWYRYRNDIWVVTTQRLIDSTRTNWFNHRMASTDLVDVEDITIERHGFLATAFNFGDVRCQTAGEVANFILSEIPKPSDVLSTIDLARDAARRSAGAQRPS